MDFFRFFFFNLQFFFIIITIFLKARDVIVQTSYNLFYVQFSLFQAKLDVDPCIDFM